MTKTLRMHCVHPVKLYKCMFEESVQLKDYKKHNRKRRFIPCKGNHKALLLSVNSTYAFKYQNKCRICFYCFLITCTCPGILSQTNTTAVSISQKHGQTSQVLKSELSHTVNKTSLHVSEVLQP